MSADNTLDKIIEIVIDKLGVDKIKITKDAKFKMHNSIKLIHWSLMFQ